MLHQQQQRQSPYAQTKYNPHTIRPNITTTVTGDRNGGYDVMGCSHSQCGGVGLWKRPVQSQKRLVVYYRTETVLSGALCTDLGRGGSRKKYLGGNNC